MNGAAKRAGPVLAMAALLAGTASGQIATPKTPKSYSDYFVRRQANNPGGVVSPGRYMMQKHLWDNPAVSPYLQLARPSSRGSSYQRYVAPELQRRERSAARQYDQKKRPAPPQRSGNRGNVPPSLYGSQSLRRPSPYHQKWYGQGQRRP